VFLISKKEKSLFDEKNYKPPPQESGRQLKKTFSKRGMALFRCLSLGERTWGFKLSNFPQKIADVC